VRVLRDRHHPRRHPHEQRAQQRKRASAVGCWGLGLGIASLAAETILLIVFIAAIASVGSAASYSASY
jgi:hypothetical protein